MGKEISFVIPTVNEGDNLYKTIQSIRDTCASTYEIIVVDNGSTDGSTEFIAQGSDPRLRLFKTGERLGVAGARNFGAAFAEGDLLIFVDAHMLLPPDWTAPILEVLRDKSVGLVVPAVSTWGKPGAVGYGINWKNERLDMDWLGKRSRDPYTVPLAGGCFQCFRWDFFYELGGYDPGMRNFGSEDLEICLRTWLLGYQVIIVPQVEVSHYFRASAPYPLAWIDSTYNMLRTVYAHFNAQRIKRVIERQSLTPHIDEALTQVNISDIWIRRRMLELKRKHDDDWFFTTFNINS